MNIRRNLKGILGAIAKPELGRIQRFKDIHKSEACYIVGDGISLKWFELDAFPTLPSFALSYLFFHKQASALRPTYGILSEPYYFYPYFRLPWPPRTMWRNRVQAEYRRLIDLHSEVNFFVNLSNFPVLRRRNVVCLYRSIPNAQFSTDCLTNDEECFHGSLRTGISLAIYMGFTTIYLIGCDYTHCPSRSLHWYEKGRGVVGEHPAYNQTFFSLAEKYANVTTITLDGGSDVLPHLTYEEFTGRSPFFRENTELAERHHLELLSSWPGYKVF